MRLGRAQNDVAADVGKGAPDVDPAAAEVDVADPQGGGLAPAQAGVGEHQHQQAPGPGRGGQRENLGMSEVDVVTALRPWQAQTASGVGTDAPAPHNSVYWFDDDMLVNTHAYGVPAHFAPVLHLRHLSSGTLFQTYARSFDRVWDQTRTTWTGTEVTHNE